MNNKESVGDVTLECGECRNREGTKAVVVEMTAGVEMPPAMDVEAIERKPDSEIKPKTAPTSLLESLKIKIDPEFKGFMRSTGEGKHDGLKEDIKRDGCRDPLVVWKGNRILLDGHHRLAICEELYAEHSEDRFKPKITEVELPDKTSAKIWMVKNQLIRRNLDESQRAMLAVLLEKLYAKQAKDRQGARTDLDPNLDQSEFGRSAEKAAKDMGVSHQSVAYAKKVAENGIPELKQMVNAGELAVSTAAKVAVLALEKQEAVCKEITKMADKNTKPDETRYRATLKEITEIIRKISPPKPKTSAPHIDEKVVKVEKKLKGVKDSLDGLETTTQPEKLSELISLGEEIIARLKAILEKSPTSSQEIQARVGEGIEQTA